MWQNGRKLRILHYWKISCIWNFLTLDEIGAGADYEGIRQKNVLEWLKEPCHTPL